MLLTWNIVPRLVIVLALTISSLGASAPVAINATFAAKYDVGNQLPNFKMLDFRGQAPRQSVSNNFATYTGFNGPTDTSVWQRIDFIFGGSNLGWYVVFSSWMNPLIYVSSQDIGGVQSWEFAVG